MPPPPFLCPKEYRNDGSFLTPPIFRFQFADFLGNDTASPAEVLNECERADGTLANLPGFDVDAKKDSLGLTNLDDDLSLSAIDAFGSGGAFNFGGTDLVAAATAAAMVDFKGFNFDALLFNATAGAG